MPSRTAEESSVAVGTRSLTGCTPDDVPQAAADGDAVDLDQRLAAVRRPLGCRKALHDHPVTQPARLYPPGVHPRCAQREVAFAPRNARDSALEVGLCRPDNPGAWDTNTSSQGAVCCEAVIMLRMRHSPDIEGAGLVTSCERAPGDAMLATVRTARRPTDVDMTAGSAAAVSAAKAATAASPLARARSQDPTAPDQLH